MNAVVEAGMKKRLGGLPAVAEILRRLDVAGIVDEVSSRGGWLVGART
jgi:hypothetical protein